MQRCHFSAGEIPARQGSFQPVVAEQLTGGWLKLSVKGLLRSSASKQAVMCSEHRAGLESCNAEADPPFIRGRPPLLRKENDRCTQQFRRGSGDSMLVHGR